MIRSSVFVIGFISLALPALAHHGGATFDSCKAVTLTGKLSRLDLINPHSWIYFDVTDKDGKINSHRYEMRSAHVLRRSGWTAEMFRIGQRITVETAPGTKP